MQERFYYLAFSVFPGVGPVKFASLIKNFGRAKDAWNANPKDLKEILGEKLTAQFEDFRKKFSIENYVNQLKRKKVSFLTIADKEYPSLLREVDKAPFVLYIKHGTKQNQTQNNTETSVIGSRLSVFSNESVGSRLISLKTGKPKTGKLTSDNRELKTDNSNIFTQPMIAVVGTRKITEYGKQVTKMLTEELVANGFTIVSGLAFGVDSVAHKTAIENGGKTIAVLGSGVDLCFPSSNLALYNSIVSGNGCVVSQYPLGEQPSKGSFPSRNRIIAGLSMAVLVTEGAEDSGALITASYAVSQGRKVFAVPGPITSSFSKGPFSLIAKGAKLVTSAKDILGELSITGGMGITSTTGSIKSIKGETKEENQILEILENERVHFDEIVRKMKSTSSKISSILSIMEIKGFIKSSSSGFFSINN